MLSFNKFHYPKVEINKNKKIRQKHNNQTATLKSPVSDNTKRILIFNNAIQLHY